jgi:hypothetical protein
MKHQYVVHRNCTQTDRAICEGGLALCAVCGGLEGALPTECPGRWMSLVEQDQVYLGLLDFLGGKWVWKVSVNSLAAYR